MRAFSFFEPEPPSEGMVCLNVGSGGHSLPGFVDLDVPSPSYDHLRTQPFTPYDIRQDPMPFADSSVDVIYSSHVIEHVEDRHVLTFLSEASRVLKPGGVLRIATPDAEFLWDVSGFMNSYWTWLHPTIAAEFPGAPAVDAATCFVREIATATYWSSMEQGVRLEVDFGEPLDAVGERLTAHLVWDEGRTWHHISFWSFDRLREAAGGLFSRCVRSKFQGSVSRYLRGPSFDINNPQMSLYVDLVR